MSCGQDASILKELQAYHSVLEDLLSISRSKNLVSRIHLDVHKNITGPMVKENLKLEDKMTLYLRISNVVIKSIVDHLRDSTEKDEETEEKLSRISDLDEAYDLVKAKQEDFEKKKDQLEKLVEETEAKWDAEGAPDKAAIKRMSKKERKELVKLWKDREKMAMKGQAEFEDLKAEWDFVKAELDKEIMSCLRGMISLKESP